MIKFTKILNKNSNKIIKNFSSRFYSVLEQTDPGLYSLIKNEEKRQAESLQLIASENLTSKSVLETLGTCLTNKYSEGYPGSRYYSGNEFIDQIEILCIKRALEAFDLDNTKWMANVQAYSGSVANLAIFNAFLKPFERVMGLGLPSGGHLSHGYHTRFRKVNCSAKYYTSLSYELDPKTELIDYEDLEKTAKRFWPKLLVTGGSAYPRDIDYAKMADIAKSVEAILMVDISHYSGLVASKLLNNPFEHADVVMTTTHKTLGGPRGAIIFAQGKYKNKINFSVFPHFQGGPHNNNIAAIATQLKEVNTERFKKHCEQIIANAKSLAKFLIKNGCKICTGGTDTHLVLWDLTPHKLSGATFDKLCDLANISLNKNSILTDKSPFKPMGVRIGTAALTSRGFCEKDFETVGEFLLRALKIALSLREKFSDEELYVLLSNEEFVGKLKNLKKLSDDIKVFLKQFKLL